MQEAYRQSLGQSHPYTLVAANNLVTYLRGTGAVERGRTLAEETLRQHDGQSRRGSSLHLVVCHQPGELPRRPRRTSRSGAGGTPDAAATAAPARPSDIRTHWSVEANLAVTLHMADREDEAREVRDRVLAEMDRVLGEDHPNGTLLREWDRNNRDLEPQPI